MRIFKYQLIFLSNILLCALSVVVYVNSPIEYSYGYNLLILVIFLIANFVYFNFNNSFKQGVGFELLFFIAFLMGNFIYPVFYYPSNPNISLFQFSINSSIINKSTSLALVAYSFYLLFSSDYNLKLSSLKVEYNINKVHFFSILILSNLFFLGYFFAGGLTRLANVYEGTAQLGDVGSDSYFSVLFEITTVLLSTLIFLVKDKKYRLLGLSYLFIIILLFFSTGSRGMSISILLILLVGYSKSIKKLNSFLVFFGIFFGAVLMYFLMLIRELGMGDLSNASVAIDTIENTSNLFDPFMDLIINNRNLYVLVDFVDRFGDVKFLNSVTSLFGLLPGVGFFIDFFNVPDYLVSGKLPTYLEFGSNPSFGLGTNMVGEAYLSLGLYGVIIVFSFFGYLVRYLRFKNSLYAYIAFLLLVGQAVFIVRSDYLFPLRKILWGIFIFYIITIVFKKSKKLDSR